MKTLIIALTGAALACALILSCGNDSPGDADAQTACDCPAAEPPLTGRIVRVTATVALAAQDTNHANADCAAGGTLVGGGCALETGDDRIFVSYTSPDQGGAESWACRWNNPTTDANTGIATAICLMPAPAN